MTVSGVKDLHYKRRLKILSKLHQSLGEYSLTESLNVTSSVILCSIETLRQIDQLSAYHNQSIIHTVTYPVT